MPTITTAGVYDLPAADYHADPIPGGSLSYSRAKLLLDEAGPAKFRHRSQAGPEHRNAFDVGTAAHAVALGRGGERLVIIDADSYRSAAARAARTSAYAEGLTPMLATEIRQVEDMAAALMDHPTAVETLMGTPEQALFVDRDGLWLRGMVDVLADGWTADYKTTADASAAGFTRSVWRYRYHMQAAWYRRLRGWLTGEWLPYRLVAQEKTAPYLVSVWEPTADYIELGERDMDDAIATYRRCVESGEWPGYPTEIQTLAPPDWAYDDEMEID